MKRMLTMILSACGIAHAATVNFTVTLGDTVPGGVGLTAGQVFPASVSYDSTLVPLTGAVTLTPLSDPTLTIDLSFAGFSYDELDDTAHPGFPQFDFVDGGIRAISFLSENKHPASHPDGYLKIEGIPNRFIYSFDGDMEFFGSVTWPSQSIPEPHTLLLLAAAVPFHRRRRPRRP